MRDRDFRRALKRTSTVFIIVLVNFHPLIKLIIYNIIFTDYEATTKIILSIKYLAQLSISLSAKMSAYCKNWIDK